MKAKSGKFVLRMNPKLHAKLDALAREKNISLNKICLQILQGRLYKKALDIDTLETDVPLFSSSNLLPLFLIKSIQKTFQPQLKAIVLFGSASRQNMTKKSDIDLLIVLDSNIAIERKLYDQWQTLLDPIMKEQNIKHEPTAHFVHIPSDPRQAGNIWFEIALEGKMIYEKDSDVFNFLRGVRYLIAKGKIQRKLSHGHPYWIKQ